MSLVMERANTTADYRRAFPVSFGDTVHSLKSERCAPPFIPFAPRGGRFIHPIGAPKPVWVKVTDTWATRADRQLQDLRAAGRSPFIDYEHKAGCLGFAKRIFWRPRYGVMLFAEWLPEGEQMIVSGACHQFSPAWLADGSDLFGVQINVGGLIHRSNQTAFGKFFNHVRPVSKWGAEKEKAAVYAEWFLEHTRPFHADDAKQVQAAKEFDRLFPSLKASFELIEAIKREVGADFDLST